MTKSSRTVYLALLLVACAFAKPTNAQQLGTIAFPTSGASTAQPEFVRGLLYLHSFEYAEAASAFQRAQALDPRFVMAYWGEALTHTHQVWNQQDLPSARAALAKLGPTAVSRLAAAPTARERGYIAAVEALYGDGSKERRDTLYASAMEQLWRANPSDDEAAVLYATALFGLTQGVRDVPLYMNAGAIAGDVFRRNPQHPGAAHLIIHAFDDPVHAPLGLFASIRASHQLPHTRST
jgi:tetratricopeptide (TPR) repeat protein